MRPPQPNLALESSKKSPPKYQDIDLTEKSNLVSIKGQKITARLVRLKLIWDENSPCIEFMSPSGKRTRLLETIFLIFELSSLLDLLGNGIRLALKDSHFCSELIHAVFNDDALKSVEGSLLKLITPLWNAETPDNVQSVLSVATLKPVYDVFDSLNVEKIFNTLIESIGKTEVKQKTSLAQIYEHVSLLGFAVGQIIGNLPQSDAGHRLIPDVFKNAFDAAFKEALAARNEFAHPRGFIKSIESVQRAGYDLVLTILQNATTHQESTNTAASLPPLPMNADRSSDKKYPNSALPYSTKSDTTQSKEAKIREKIENNLSLLNIESAKAQKILDDHPAYQNLPAYQKVSQLLTMSLPLIQKNALSLEERRLLNPQIETVHNELSSQVNRLKLHIQAEIEKEQFSLAQQQTLKQANANKEKKQKEIWSLANKFRSMIDDTLSTHLKYQQYREQPTLIALVQEYTDTLQRWENGLDILSLDELNARYRDMNLQYPQNHALSFERVFLWKIDGIIKACEEVEKKDAVERDKLNRQRMFQERKERDHMAKSLRLLELVTDADCDTLSFSKDEVLNFCNQYKNNDDSRLEDVERYKKLVEIIRDRKEKEEQTNIFVAQELKLLKKKAEQTHVFVTQELRLLQQNEAQCRLQLGNEENSIWKETSSASSINKAIWLKWIRDHMDLTEQEWKSVINETPETEFEEVGRMIMMLFEHVDLKKNIKISSFLTVMGVSSPHLFSVTLYVWANSLCYGTRNARIKGLQGLFDYILNAYDEGFIQKIKMISPLYPIFAELNQASFQLVTQQHNHSIGLWGQLKNSVAVAVGVSSHTQSNHSYRVFGEQLHSSTGLWERTRTRVAYSVGLLPSIQNYPLLAGFLSIFFLHLSTTTKDGQWTASLAHGMALFISKDGYQVMTESLLNAPPKFPVNFMTLIQLYFIYSFSCTQNAELWINGRPSTLKDNYQHFLSLNLTAIDSMHNSMRDILGNYLQHYVSFYFETYLGKTNTANQCPHYFIRTCIFYNAVMMLMKGFNINPLTLKSGKANIFEGYVNALSGITGVEHEPFAIDATTHDIVFKNSYAASWHLADLAKTLCVELKHQFPDHADKIDTMIDTRFPQYESHIDNPRGQLTGSGYIGR